MGCVRFSHSTTGLSPDMLACITLWEGRGGGSWRVDLTTDLVRIACAPEMIRGKRKAGLKHRMNLTIIEPEEF